MKLLSHFNQIGIGNSRASTESFSAIGNRYVLEDHPHLIQGSNNVWCKRTKMQHIKLLANIPIKPLYSKLISLLIIWEVKVKEETLFHLLTTPQATSLEVVQVQTQ